MYTEFSKYIKLPNIYKCNATASTQSYTSGGSEVFYAMLRLMLANRKRKAPLHTRGKP